MLFFPPPVNTAQPRSKVSGDAQRLPAAAAVVQVRL